MKHFGPEVISGGDDGQILVEAGIGRHGDGITGAGYLNKNVPGIMVPDHLIKEMESSAHPLETGIQIAARQISQLKGICDGVHIMAIGLEDKVLDILDEAGF